MRQASIKLLRRDYYRGDTVYVSARLHESFRDEEIGLETVLRHLLSEAKIIDGDEIEIVLTATEKRPHGDCRIVISQEKPYYRQETEKEIRNRLAAYDRQK